jgi:hypothetical protein
MEQDRLRFEKYVQKEDKGCWRWTGGSDIKKYGIFFFNGKTAFAHRVALLIYEKIKQLTPGLQVRHSCNETSCVNPEHLSEGTREQNAADKVSHGTSLRGTRCHFAKLDWQKVSEIRRKASEGIKRKKLSEDYGVSPGTIGSILKNKSWILSDGSE